MSSKPQVTCHCGQRILMKDILKKGVFFRVFGPSFVYVKFRCSHCKRLGERFVPQEHWEAGAFRDVPKETSREERLRLAALGEIDLDEMIDFHHQLHTLPLRELLETSDG